MPFVQAYFLALECVFYLADPNRYASHLSLGKTLAKSLERAIKLPIFVVKLPRARTGIISGKAGSCTQPA